MGPTKRKQSSSSSTVPVEKLSKVAAEETVAARVTTLNNRLLAQQAKLSTTSVAGAVGCKAKSGRKRKHYRSTRTLDLVSYKHSEYQYMINIEVEVDSTKNKLEANCFAFTDIVDFKSIFFINSEYDCALRHMVFVKSRPEKRDFLDLSEEIQNQIEEMVNMRPEDSFKSIPVDSYSNYKESEASDCTGDVIKSLVPYPNLIENLRNGKREGDILVEFYPWPTNFWNLSAAGQVYVIDKYMNDETISGEVGTVDLHDYVSEEGLESSPRWIQHYYNWTAWLFNFYNMGMSDSIQFNDSKVASNVSKGFLDKWSKSKETVNLMKHNIKRNCLYANYTIPFECGSHVYIKFDNDAKTDLLALDKGVDTYITLADVKILKNLDPTRERKVWPGFEEEMTKSKCGIVPSVNPETQLTDSQTLQIRVKDRKHIACGWVWGGKTCPGAFAPLCPVSKRRHFAKCHQSDNIQCPICNVENHFFQYDQSLQNHITKSHNSLNQYKCDKCFCRFARPDTLKFHRVSCIKNSKVLSHRPGFSQTSITTVVLMPESSTPPVVSYDSVSPVAGSSVQISASLLSPTVSEISQMYMSPISPSPVQSLSSLVSCAENTSWDAIGSKVTQALDLLSSEVLDETNISFPTTCEVIRPFIHVCSDFSCSFYFVDY